MIRYCVVKFMAGLSFVVNRLLPMLRLNFGNNFSLALKLMFLIGLSSIMIGRRTWQLLQAPLSAQQWVRSDVNLNLEEAIRLRLTEPPGALIHFRANLTGSVSVM